MSERPSDNVKRAVTYEMSPVKRQSTRRNQISQRQPGQDHEPRADRDNRRNMPTASQSNGESLLKTVFGSCGTFMETASFFARTSEAPPRDEHARKDQPFSNVSLIRRARQVGRYQLYPTRIREGATVAVPVVPFRESGDQMYNSSFSFDDNISALSAHTLNDMATQHPKATVVHRVGDEGSVVRQPRNGDILLPPSPARTSGSSTDSQYSDKENAIVTGTSTFPCENCSQVSNDSKPSQESKSRTLSTSSSSSAAQFDSVWRCNGKKLKKTGRGKTKTSAEI